MTQPKTTELKWKHRSANTTYGLKVGKEGCQCPLWGYQTLVCEIWTFFLCSLLIFISLSELGTSLVNWEAATKAGKSQKTSSGRSWGTGLNSLIFTNPKQWEKLEQGSLEYLIMWSVKPADGSLKIRRELRLHTKQRKTQLFKEKPAQTTASLQFQRLFEEDEAPPWKPTLLWTESKWLQIKGENISEDRTCGFRGLLCV